MASVGSETCVMANGLMSCLTPFSYLYPISNAHSIRVMLIKSEFLAMCYPVHTPLPNPNVFNGRFGVFDPPVWVERVGIIVDVFIKVDRPVVAYDGRAGRDAVAHVVVVFGGSVWDPSSADGRYRRTSFAMVRR